MSIPYEGGGSTQSYEGDGSMSSYEGGASMASYEGEVQMEMQELIVDFTDDGRILLEVKGVKVTGILPLYSTVFSIFLQWSSKLSYL